MSSSPSEVMKKTVTQIIQRVAAGDAAAQAELFEIALKEMRPFAHGVLAKESRPQIPGPTELISHAMVRLFDQDFFEKATQNEDKTNRRYFYGALARAMRQLLIEHARSADRQPEVLLTTMLYSLENQFRTDFLLLNEKLEELRQLDERDFDLIQMRYFLELTQAEMAVAVGKSEAWVSTRLKYIFTWLRRELREIANDT